LTGEVRSVKNNIGPHNVDIFMAQELVRYDAMCRAIVEAHKVDEVKAIRDQAAALEAYARIAVNIEAERQASEIRVRAERKAGQLLTKTIKRGGYWKDTEGKSVLESLGISSDQSSLWQRLGALSDDEFEIVIGDKTAKPSTRGILRATAPAEPRVDDNALWLWGRLEEFERRGLLDKTPAEIMETMSDMMRDDVHTRAPRVAAWLKKVGAFK
jgi:hypothetical protein